VSNYLILAYYFPPDGDIGGRRWAKFAKYLVEDGHDVTILTRSECNSENPRWYADTASYRGNIETFRNTYPSTLQKSNLSTIGKVLYRLALWRVKRNTCGNYYDPTCLLGEDFINRVRKIILKKKIDITIISGFPFYWQYLVSSLISEFSSVKFVADFRDPWLNNELGYGYNDLPKNRYLEEQKFERKVIERYHHIISVSKEMNDYFEGLLKKKFDTVKFKEIPNGFDPADKVDCESKPEKKIFVFTGNLYLGLEYILPEFLRVVQQIETERPDLDFEFRFYGSAPDYFINEIKALSKVRFFGKVSLAEAHQALGNSAYAVLFLMKDLLFSRSTKFYEYLSYGKKIVLFSSPGKTADFLVDNNIGYHFSPGEIKNNLIDLIERDISSVPPEFNVDDFSVATIARNLNSFVTEK
jgi:hypothetical protein